MQSHTIQIDWRALNTLKPINTITSFVLRPVLDGRELGVWVDSEGYVHPTNANANGLGRSPVEVERYERVDHQGRLQRYLKIVKPENRKGCFLSAGGYGCWNINEWCLATSWRLYGEYLYSTWHGAALGLGPGADDYYIETYQNVGKVQLIKFPRNLNEHLYQALDVFEEKDMPPRPEKKEFDMIQFIQQADRRTLVMLYDIAKKLGAAGEKVMELIIRRIPSLKGR